MIFRGVDIMNDLHINEIKLEVATSLILFLLLVSLLLIWW